MCINLSQRRALGPVLVELVGQFLGRVSGLVLNLLPVSGFSFGVGPYLYTGRGGGRFMIGALWELEEQPRIRIATDVSTWKIFIFGIRNFNLVVFGGWNVCLSS